MPLLLMTTPRRLTLLVAFGVAGFLLSVAGLLEMKADAGQSASYLTAIYHALQLFLLGGEQYDVPVPWTLQLGRILCGVTTTAAVISMIYSVLSSGTRAFMCRLFGNHVIVVGPGRLALAVARRAQNEGYRVLMAVAHSKAAGLRAAAGPDLPILVGKLNAVSFLDRCGARKASRILAVSNDDADNLAAAAALENLRRPKEGQVRKVLVSNSAARASLDAGASFLTDTEVISLDFQDRRVRRFFAEHPLDFLPIPPAQAGSHAKQATLIVIGWGTLAEKLVVQAGRIGHFASGAKTRVLLISPQASEGFQDCLRRWPALNKVLEIQTADFNPGDPGIRGLLLDEFDRATKNQEPITVALVEGEQVSERLGSALWVQRLLSDDAVNPCIQIVADFENSSELSALVEAEGFQKDHPNLRTFTSPRLEKTIDLDLGDSVDALAKGFHKEYLASRESQRQEKPDLEFRPAEKPWPRLEETFRASSRALADHLPIKLRAIGCKIVDDAKGKHPSLELPDNEIEMLSKLEHARWSAERLLEGWVYAEKRNEQRMHHNLLVPWNELSEGDQYLDRDVVKNATEVLSPLMLQIARFPKK